MRFTLIAAIATLVAGGFVRADVPVTDDVPDLTAAQTRDLEHRADHGDDAAAFELAWRIGPEKRPLHYLLMAARHGNCDAIERAAEHYESEQDWAATENWVSASGQANCRYASSLRFNLYLDRNPGLAAAANRGDCVALNSLRDAAERLRAQDATWLVARERHCP